MAYTLVIADDDAVIRQGLARLIDWAGLGFELIGVCKDGDELAALLAHTRADVVLSDVSMPGASGLDVLAATRADGLQCRFVILSGYTEFEYAREAVRLNAYDYLLKPVSPAKLKAVFTRIREEMDDERRREKHLQHLEAQALDALLARAVAGELDGAQLERSLTLAGLDPCLMELRVALVSFSGDGAPEDLARALTLMPGVQVCRTVDGNVALLLESGRDFDVNEAREYIYSLTGHDAAPRTEAYYASLADMCDSRHAALSAFDASPDMGLLHQALASGNLAAADAVLRRMMEHGMSRTALIYLMDGLRTYAEQIHPECAPTLEFTLRLANIPAQASPGELIDAGCARLGVICAAINNPPDADPIFEACRYLQSHCLEDVSLNSLAETVHISPVYLSRALKLKTGETFTAMLTRLRMQAAAKLLRDTAMPVQEIAEKCGFANEKYFYRLFKRVMGAPPGAWRKQWKDGLDT